MSEDAQKKLRICLIGNSHSGCFKSGWDAISSAYPAVEIKFYPHCGQYYDLFRVHKSEKMLSVDNDFIQNHFNKLSGNDGNIALDTFDLCVIVGGLHSWRYFDPGYSKQVIDAMVADYLDAAHVSVLLKKIREISEVPVSVLATPFGASRSVNKGMHQDGLIKDSTMLNVALKQKYGACFLEQPHETLEAPTRSKLEYVAGERLTGASLVPGNPQEIIDDLVHMNAAYGALFLSKILAERGFKPENLKLPEPDGHIPFAERVAAS